MASNTLRRATPSDGSTNSSANATIRVEPVTSAQTDLARVAHARFGKGSGHAAQLNFGDCFAYALAKSLGAPLLFKGEDFGHTDVEAAL